MSIPILLAPHMRGLFWSLENEALTVFGGVLHSKVAFSAYCYSFHVFQIGHQYIDIVVLDESNDARAF